MKKIIQNSDNILKCLIGTLFVLLPFLDMLRTTFVKDIELFNIAIIELVNIVLIGLALLITIIKLFKKDKKSIIFLIIFLAICLVYMYLHYQNLMKFDTKIFAKAKFNFIVESFYIYRVYVLPLILLFVLIKNKDVFNKDFYLKIAKIVISIISFSIIFLNIFKISYISYSADHNFITHNMFDFIFYNGNFKLISARGWFDSANELSATLLMLLPLNIYMLYKEKKPFNVILLVSQLLCMILLGTRTSAFGSTAVCIFALISYIIIQFIKHNKIDLNYLKRFGMIILICTAYFSISATMMARINDGFRDFSVHNKSAYKKLSDLKDLDSLEKLVKKYSDEYKVNELLLKLYPIKNDKEFWFKIFSRNKALNNNSRILKTDIIKRINERNNNPQDKYLGMGYTLNFMDLERDYVYQYYIFGIFGVLLFIVPYILLLFINAFRVLFNLKNNFKFEILLYLMAPAMGLVLAYLSGHVFGWVSPTMYLVLTSALITVAIKKKGSAK